MGREEPKIFGQQTKRSRCRRESKLLQSEKMSRVSHWIYLHGIYLNGLQVMCRAGLYH